VAVVFIQWSNIFTCKSKKQSLIHSGFNEVMIYGIICETCICLLLCYVPGIDSVFGARPLEPLMFGGPGFIFSMMLLMWDEVRKFLIRSTKPTRG
jgi:sodium/potassium-transporting ATPase subunit alpha